MKLKSFGIALLSCHMAISAPAGTVPFILDGNRVYAQVQFVHASLTGYVKVSLIPTT